MDENPIALKSKKKLTEAMGELLHEKPYREVTITELCDRAGLSRPAFYQNFDDIGDVVRNLIYEKVKTTADGMNLGNRIAGEELAEAYFHIVDENIELMQIAVDNHLTGMIIEMCTIVFGGMAQSHGNLGESGGYYENRYYAAFTGAGAATVLASWLAEGRQVDEEEVVGIIEAALDGRGFVDSRRTD